MATTSSLTHHKEKANLPPKRGKIKAEIFSSFVKFVTSKGGKISGNNGDNSNAGGSASTTPPPSAYNSDVSS
ncbi:hypothetical protein Lal_00029413 [Lupinus albus]|uniref:Uncharacterized protein n=1 Tax=Lupinus albus TaxID=3870 RepID=A0A6A4P3M9_LUPAL|nr:hypothetical protein Lalb_Chr19g0137551 [Lupinus albus]KAF1885524.1 hypothetical protein Lal_00029413 [Lupinus albus]